MKFIYWMMYPARWLILMACINRNYITSPHPTHIHKEAKIIANNTQKDNL